MKAIHLTLFILMALTAVMLFSPRLATALAGTEQAVRKAGAAVLGSLIMLAEVVSKQGAKIVAGTKLTGADQGVERCITITSPDTVTWANGDTLGAGTFMPTGSRILGASISNTAMGASAVCAVGIRNPVTKAAISASGIASAADVSAANTSLAVSNGALVAAGVESVTTQDAEPYITLSGATPTANAQIRVTVRYLAP